MPSTAPTMRNVTEEELLHQTSHFLDVTVWLMIFCIFTFFIIIIITTLCMTWLERRRHGLRGEYLLLPAAPVPGYVAVFSANQPHLRLLGHYHLQGSHNHSIHPPYNDHTSERPPPSYPPCNNHTSERPLPSHPPYNDHTSERPPPSYPPCNNHTSERPPPSHPSQDYATTFSPPATTTKKAQQQLTRSVSSPGITTAFYLDAFPFKQ